MKNKMVIVLPMVMMVFTNVYADYSIAQVLKVRDDVLVASSNIECVERSLMEDIESYDIGLVNLAALDLAGNEDVYERVTHRYINRKKLEGEKREADEEILAQVRKVKDINVNVMAILKCYMELAALDLAGNDDVYESKMNSMLEEAGSMLEKANHIFERIKNKNQGVVQMGE